MLDQIGRDSTQIERLGQAESLLHLSRGTRRLTSANTNKTSPDAGVADIKRGLELNPELAKDPGIMKKLEGTGYSADQLTTWFPQLKAKEGARK